MLTGYLHYQFEVTLAEFRAKAIGIAGPRLHYTAKSKFDLWQNLDSRVELNLKILTRTTIGYFRILSADGGGRFDPPPTTQRPSAKLLDRFLTRKWYLIATGLTFPNVLQNFICGVTDDVTGRVQGVFLPVLVSPGKAAISNWNKAEATTWNVSGVPQITRYVFSDIVSIEDHPRSQGLKR